MKITAATLARTIDHPMKYLHVISSLDPESGGPAEGVKQLTYATIRAGHQVEIASLDGDTAPWVEDYPCPVHQFGANKLGKYRYNPDLKQWLIANSPRFDAVVVDGLWQYHGYATWRALRHTRTPYFVYTHGMLDPWFKHRYPLKHLKKMLYWPWAEYRVLRDAKAVLFTCEQEKILARQSFRRYRANEVVVGHGTPGPSGNAVAQRESFLARFPELRNKRRVLFLGRLHPKKGGDLLIEAFGAVAASEPALHLVMAGPDHAGERARLERRAHDLGLSNITWTGMLHADLKWGALHAAEVFVLPSHQENFGIAVAEALACRVPVLISNKVNIWREIVEDRAGIVADDTLTGTVQLLRIWLALSFFEREQMMRNAERSFWKHFHIDAVAECLRQTISK